MLLQNNSVRNKTSAGNTDSAKKRSNIIAVDESAQSLVDFDLSESKFTMGLFENTNRDPSPSGNMERLRLNKQGTDNDVSMPSAIRPSETPVTMKSGGSRKGSGAAAEDLGLSLDESDFGLSESNFSHSMMSNKIGSFAT